MNRREFLACSAAAGVTAVPTPRAPRLRAAAAPPAPWYATMRRCGQLNFNERDPLTLDVGAWADYWASLRVNALLVNGGGIMAFYPTDVPYHHRSAFLGTRDLFGEMAAAARARSIRVMARLLEVWRLWDGMAGESRPDALYVGNLGGGIRVVKDLARIGQVAGWFNADHQGRSGDTPLWDCAQQGRVARSVMQGRTITNVTGAYSNSRPVWRHVAKPAAETTLWMAQTVASGMVPWFHWLGGSPEDERWRDTGRQFFAWLAAQEPHFRNTRSVADLAVLFPQSTIAFSRQGTDYLQGLYAALLQGRFVFDFVHESDLSEKTLGRYRALLVPNAAYLADEPCRQIRAYVQAGGSLLATFETSRRNEWGDARSEPALADLWGLTVAGELVGPAANSYMRIEERHPVLAGFEGTSLLPGPENRVPVRLREAGRPVLTVVPSYPAFPPEMVYPRTAHTDEPAVVLRQRDSSRVAYFPGDVERTFWRSGNPDLGRLLQNTVRWVRGDQTPPVSIAGEGLLEAFAWETEPGYALHLLNYTTPNLTWGLVDRFHPIEAQRVRFEVAAGRTIRRVEALRSGRVLPFEHDGTAVRFEVPAVVDYEVVALT